MKKKGMNKLVHRIFDKHHIHEPFVKLTTQGVANEIYATENYILRIPTDHPEAISDALTESVAAPLVRKHGIKTPALICFDHTHEIINKPYSIWERIHGLTLGEIDCYLDYRHTWEEVGFQLGLVHTEIVQCHDPDGWLDHSDREYTQNSFFDNLYPYQKKSRQLLELAESLYKEHVFSYKKAFVHGDTNKFNFLCTNQDRLVSIIDWGDAGWADPAIDFYMIPIKAVKDVMNGYQQSAKEKVNEEFINRILLDKIWIGIEEKQDVKMLEKDIMELEKNLRKLGVSVY